MGKSILKSDTVPNTPFFWVSLKGTSMFPVLLSNDKALVKKIAIEDLYKGDIIVWTDESQNLIAHRVLSLEQSSSFPNLTTKGDLCLDPDPPIKFDKVLGKVVAVLREKEIKWIRELDGNRQSMSEKGENFISSGFSTCDSSTCQKPSYKNLQVLDLRDISKEAIDNIGYVEDVKLVLLSLENISSWEKVQTKNVRRVITVPQDYRVYTGQPELIPELIEFIETPLHLVVAGQLFLTSFNPSQIPYAIGELILDGQVLVNSLESKEALEPLTRILSGEIRIVPHESVRWIGSSILGPEFLINTQHDHSLVAIGELLVSNRLKNVPYNISLHHIQNK